MQPTPMDIYIYIYINIYGVWTLGTENFLSAHPLLQQIMSGTVFISSPLEQEVWDSTPTVDRRVNLSLCLVLAVLYLRILFPEHY
jgi:hypothetical protein